jgi:hypothetical protein
VIESSGFTTGAVPGAKEWSIEEEALLRVILKRGGSIKDAADGLERSFDDVRSHVGVTTSETSEDSAEQETAPV